MVKNPPAAQGNPGSIPGLGRSPGEGNGSPLQYSCLGSPVERGAWRAYGPWGHREPHTTKRASGDTDKSAIKHCSHVTVAQRWEVSFTPVSLEVKNSLHEL